MAGRENRLSDAVKYRDVSPWSRCAFVRRRKRRLAGQSAEPAPRFATIDRAAEAGSSRMPGFTGEEISELEGLPREIALRRRAVTAHVVLAEVADALMREKSAVGLFRPELGVVQPPQMVVEFADLLSKGQAPIPLWVGIRVSKPDLVHGRTLGLPLFGHLDLEVVGSLHSEEEVYAMLSNVVDYLLSADAFLLPGQSVGYRDGKDLAVSQAVSPADRAAVLHIGF